MPQLYCMLKLRTKFADVDPDRFRIEWVSTDDESLPYGVVLISFSSINPTVPRTFDQLTAALHAALPSRHLDWLTPERDCWVIDCDKLRQLKPFASCEWLRGKMWLRASWKPARIVDAGMPLYYDALQFVIPESATDRHTLGIITSDIFVVHGHDIQLLTDVTTELRRVGLNPVVLSREPSEGDTIIEKFERLGRVGFAVVLLSPDDLGAARGDTMSLKPRARQNVIFELGYFLAHLGRRRVCALHAGQLDLPSDYHGVVYVEVDDSGSWRDILGKELRAAGLGRIGTDPAANHKKRSAK